MKLELKRSEIPLHLLKYFRPVGFKPKDEIDIPNLVCEALRRDGWYRRQTIIWHKPNPMPESVTDRPTKSHEYLFLLAKSSSYFYDQDAIREPQKETSLERKRSSWNGNKKRDWPGKAHNNFDRYMGKSEEEIAALPGRNKRSVWTVPTHSYEEAHFATFPPELIEPCILAGTSAKGCCAVCGAPWVRIVEREAEVFNAHAAADQRRRNQGAKSGGTERVTLGATEHIKRTSVGWQPTCSCNADTMPCTVLDPFNGSGTTGAVALKHGRHYVGIDLNPDYILLSKKRIESTQPLLFDLSL